MNCRYRYCARLLLGLCTGWAALGAASYADPGLSLTAAAYDASRMNDPTLKSATHLYDASQQEEAIGRGGLYLRVSLTLRYGKGGRTDGGTDSGYVNSNDYQADNMTLAAQ